MVISKIKSQFLSKVIDFERDITLVKANPEGKALENIHYRTLLGMKEDLTPQTTPALLTEEGEDEEELSESEGEEGDEEADSKFVNAARPRDESPNSKKVVTCFHCFAADGKLNDSPY